MVGSSIMQVQGILNAQEMKGERLVNQIRFGFAILGFLMLAGAWETNTNAANLVLGLQGGCWLGYSLLLFLFFRWYPKRYIWWLKYVTITLDLALVSLTALASAVNHSGMLEYFFFFMPLMAGSWNLLSGFRVSLRACAYSALLTATINAGILVVAVKTGAVAVSVDSVFGVPAINILDESIAIVFVSLSGAIAGVIASTARRLVRHAAEATVQRERLEKEKARLGRYLSKDLVEMVLKDPDLFELGGSRYQATILFSDIRNFTPFSERREPEEVVRFLNHYFTRMSEIVFRHGGTLDKYLGDGLMVEFGVPFALSSAPRVAVLAALEMLQEVERLNEEEASQGGPRIEIGVGIATGPVVAGNIGSLERMEYTCIGDTVNYAARLEAINKALSSNIVLCETTRTALDDIIKLQSHTDIKVKGKRDPMVLYSVTLDDGIDTVIQRMIDGCAADDEQQSDQDSGASDNGA